MFRRILPLVAVAAILVPALARAQEASPGGVSISIEPSPVEIVGGTDPLDVSIRVRGGTAGVLRLRLVDAAGGGDDVVGRVLSVSPASFIYDPDAGDRAFIATIALVAGAPEEPIAAALVARLSSADAGGEEQASVTVPVIASADGDLAGSFAPGALRVAIDDLSFEKAPFTIVDRLLPDLPGIVGHGPIGAVVTVRNAGSAVLEARVTWAYRRVGPLDLFRGGEPPTLSYGGTSRLLLPGGTFTDDGSSRIDLSGGPFEALPLIGFVRVTATVDGGLEGATAQAVTGSRVILVFPWSEVLVASVAWVVYRRRFGRVIDLRYSNEPLPIEPGAHRRTVVRKTLLGTFDRVVGAGAGKRRAH